MSVHTSQGISAGFVHELGRNLGAFRSTRRSYAIMPSAHPPERRTQIMQQILDIFLHLDRHVAELAQSLGGGLYVLLFLIIFAETGLVVTPFLPGDSLLFAVGALCAMPETGLSLWLMMVLLIIAAIIGDAVNYSIGRRLGPAVFRNNQGMFLNKAHLRRTQEFYDRHGGKTIVLARFVPIVRTFAPFVAGVGQMSYGRFAMYNVVGAIVWVVGFLALGFMFGNMPIVKEQFHYVIFGIIFLSILPAVIEILRARAQSAKLAEAKDEQV